MDYQEIAQSEAAKAVEGGLVVFLGSCGNPDFGQNPFQRHYLSAPNRLVAVSSLNEASAQCRDFIYKNELGGGNWLGGNVFNASTGESAAWVSFNGRIWDCKMNTAPEPGSGDAIRMKEVMRIAKKQAPAVYASLAALAGEVVAKRPRPRG